MRVTELGVWLHDDRVATLHAPKVGRVTCRYDDDALQRHPLNSPLLSCSLPVRTGARPAWAFATGLLPEGRHRQQMASMAGVSVVDLLGMLDRFGRDVAGAVIVSADAPPVRDSRVQPYGTSGLAEAVRDLDDHPLGLYDDSELSLAGLQDKMLLVATDDGWARPVKGYPSTHILKVDDRLRRGLVRAEHACLELAHASGLLAAESALLTVEDVECIVVRRFDREVGTDGAVRRIHQEDACQALGIDPEGNQRRAKYEAFGGPGLKAVASLLDSWALDPEHALAALLDQVVFTAAIGNADAHGKNIAVLHPVPTGITLAPLYDTVPTLLWPRLRTHAAMTIGGRDDLREIGLDDIVAEARSWPLDPDWSRARTTELLTRLLAMLDDGLVDVDTPALPMIADRVRQLLRD